MKFTAAILKRQVSNMEGKAVLEKLGIFFKGWGAEKDSFPQRVGMAALYRKELADHLNSPRFLLIFSLLAVTSAVSFIGAMGGIQNLAAENKTFLFLKLFTTSSSSIPSFASFLGFLGPLVGLTLGFDAINRERSQGTLNRLVAQPIYRDAVINGKFLAGATAVTILVFSIGLFFCGASLLRTGLMFSGEEVVRVLVFLLFSVVYINFWLGLAIFFSVLCRHAATSALAGIAIWIFFAFFMNLLAKAVADALFPVNDLIQATGNMMGNYTCNLVLNRISPYYLFGEAISTILDPGVRSIGIVTTAQLSGAIVGYLPLGQSLLLIWPHLVGLIALMLASFAASYICFMRQEIRV